jgi:uncharacterized protein
MPKRQRIRDPVHNLIEFGADPFDQMLWRVIQTHEFQRLRRIRQLGFSEFVFPGATHTRFAHSIGVLQTARLLMRVIERHLGTGYHHQKAEVALAAALVHDVGHGMFSHAFEEIGRKLDLPLAHHETVSERLICDSEITRVLGEFGSGFAKDVAGVAKGGQPGNLYGAVVSSQFDADRLDYMQRDRMMTGVESSRIDATWLLANLEVLSVPTGADDQAAGTVETLVLGRKAFQVAESYILSLFQLYPNVYFHKATRAAEKVFADLFLHLVPLVREGHWDKTGLPENHPICRFATEPNELDRVVALDDAVFWGAVPLMMDAGDGAIADRARRLWHRDLPKCIDVRLILEQETPHDRGADSKVRGERNARIQRRCQQIVAAVEASVADRPALAPPILIDQVRRQPYKRYGESRTMLNQILIRQGTDSSLDMADISPVVASAETFEVCRIYVIRGDNESETMIMNIIRTSPEESTDVTL